MAEQQRPREPQKEEKRQYGSGNPRPETRKEPTRSSGPGKK